ncbi:hypothetical protein C8A05DRAFT_29755 [Staphylotrichum tortipilum]|uniref:Uncharacterized protein n=1 Tax=Staphylotrichum tortipilum TaxID=2831512 RepID=A0AAN6RXD1_9PEZI|nr:hypothetical protein C8A05DRAFT_29755 [Staphylotrichum longicolle]
MWGTTLGSPPPRPPPLFDPVVEAWLDSLPPPPTKPSPKELRQWRLAGDYHGLGRNVFAVCLILRGVSLVVALVVTGITASVVGARAGGFAAPDRLVPILVVCPVVVIWSAAEFIVSCILQDGGISPKIHAVVDGLLFLGLATAMGILLVDIICGVVSFSSEFDTAAQEIAAACLLVVMMVIHSFILFFYICSYADKAWRKSRATAGGLTTPYVQPGTPWPATGNSAVDKSEPMATPVPLNLNHGGTTVELHEFTPQPGHIPSSFGASWQQPAAAPERPPPAALETALFAQAISGLWGVEEGSSPQARPPRGYGAAVSSAADHQPATMGRYM